MENRDIPKHVYIFGNKSIGFHGHSYDKADAKNIKKTRKGLHMVKIDNDTACQENLSVNTEFLKLYGDIYVTAEEEEYFIESFQQFQDDSIRHAKQMLNHIQFIKFTSKEQRAIDYLVSFLNGYIEFMEHGRYEDENYEWYDNMFDHEAALRWFVENVL